MIPYESQGNPPLDLDTHTQDGEAPMMNLDGEDGQHLGLLFLHRTRSVVGRFKRRGR